MDIKIQQAENRELPAIYKLIEKAFADMQESDHQEHILVKRRRRLKLPCKSYL